MTAPHKLAQAPTVHSDTRSESLSLDVKKTSGTSAYWGDRLTVKFWLLCIGLMMAMSLVEVLHRFVLFLMGRSPTP